MSGSRHDAHTHVWPARVPFPERLSTPSGGGADGLLATMDRAGVARAAVITPRAMGWDDSPTLAAARAHPDRFVAVVRFDVTDDVACDQLRAAIDVGAGGVRITTDDGSLAAFRDADAFWEVVAQAGLPVAVNATADELPIVDALAADHPNTAILLDHAGRPDVTAGIGGADFTRVLDLARLPNVSVKTPNVPYFSESGPPFDDLDAFLDVILDRFGATRVLWGTDWPLCATDHDYGASVATIDRVLARRSAHEADLVLRENFGRVYGYG